MRRAADACTTLRIALAPVFTWAIVRAHADPSLLPLLIFVVAAVSDFADGRLARAAGAVRVRGRLFDHGADVVFLFPALFALAGAGRVSFLLPGAALLAFVLYALDGWRRGGSLGSIALAPSQYGAVGGVLNYVVVGGAAGALALGPSPLDRLVTVSALLAAAANLAAALERGSALCRARTAPDRTLTSRIGRL